MKSRSSGALKFLYIDHYGSDLSNASIQSLRISDLPNVIDLTIDSDSSSYSASQDIESFQYHASNGTQRQAVRILGIPDSFDADFGDTLSWSTARRSRTGL